MTASKWPLLRERQPGRLYGGGRWCGETTRVVMWWRRVVWRDNQGGPWKNQHLGLVKGLGSLVRHWREVKVAPGRLLAMEYQNSIVTLFTRIKRHLQTISLARKKLLIILVGYCAHLVDMSKKTP